MHRRRIWALLAPVFSIALVVSPARAAFHLWHIKEVFSSTDGAVQFIEMFDSFGGETAVNGFALTANSDGVIKTFTFPSNLAHNTPGSLLIATSGFGSLAGGVTPDFTFSQSTTPFTGSFFDPNATNITIRFNGSSDTMIFTGASLPEDGVHSLTDAGATGFPPGTPNISSGVNSPTNLLGNSGSVNVPPPLIPTGDYNLDLNIDAADYTVWRDAFGQGAAPKGSGADGDGDGTIDADDYTFWKTRFGVLLGGAGGSTAAVLVPEPALFSLMFTGLGALFFARSRARRLRTGI